MLALLKGGMHHALFFPSCSLQKMVWLCISSSGSNGKEMRKAWKRRLSEAISVKSYAYTKYN